MTSCDATGSASSVPRLIFFLLTTAPALFQCLMGRTGVFLFLRGALAFLLFGACRLRLFHQRRHGFGLYTPPFFFLFLSARGFRFGPARGLFLFSPATVFFFR